MSQDSLTLPTTGTLSGLDLVLKLNAALANLASIASGATDPSTLPGGVVPFSMWMDTSVNPPLIRQRNAGNTAWQMPYLSVGHGQCRLSYVSTTQIKLAPFNGTGLIINGVSQQVPSAGVTYTLSGLSASTLYYVYAYMNSGTMTLELSTTGRVTGTNGVAVKSGDATRTFVGLVRTTGATQFTDAQTQRFVRSFFNDPGIDGLAWFSTGRATTSTTFVEINTEIRVEFLTFADDLVWFGGSGISTSTASAQLNSTVGAIDAGAEVGTYSMGYVVGGTGGTPFSFCKAKKGLGEGYHYATLLGKVSAGTGTWSGGAASPSVPDVCAITIGVRR